MYHPYRDAMIYIIIKFFISCVMKKYVMIWGMSHVTIQTMFTSIPSCYNIINVT